MLPESLVFFANAMSQLSNGTKSQKWAGMFALCAAVT